MVKLHRRMKREKMQSRMLLQVHDELVFETPIEVAEAEAAVIREEMVNAMKLSVPFEGGSGMGEELAGCEVEEVRHRPSVNLSQFVACNKAMAQAQSSWNNYQKA